MNDGPDEQERIAGHWYPAWWLPTPVVTLAFIAAGGVAAAACTWLAGGGWGAVKPASAVGMLVGCAVECLRRFLPQER